MLVLTSRLPIQSQSNTRRTTRHSGAGEFRPRSRVPLSRPWERGHLDSPHWNPARLSTAGKVFLKRPWNLTEACCSLLGPAGCGLPRSKSYYKWKPLLTCHWSFWRKAHARLQPRCYTLFVVSRKHYTFLQLVLKTTFGCSQSFIANQYLRARSPKKVNCIHDFPSIIVFNSKVLH